MYEQLRGRGAVVHLPEHDWFLVTRADIAREVLRDAGRFSSRVHKHTAPPPEVADEVAAIRSQGWPYSPALGTNDPPDHTRLRRLVQRAFTPRSLAWMQPLVRQTAEELAERPARRHRGRLPVGVRRAPPRLGDLARARAAGDAPRRHPALVGGGRGVDRRDARRPDVAGQRTDAAALPADDGGRDRGRPPDPARGLLTTLVQAADHPEAGEEPIPLAQLLTLLRELVIAGNETSGKLITEIVRLLDTRPDEWARVREDPERARAVVEEALRWSTPSQTAFRRATADTRLDGVDIPAGAVLVVSFASANRDEAVYAEPARFDPDRAGVQQHLAFGLGIHACIGNPLARMEAVTAVQVLAEQVESLSVRSGFDPTYNASFMVRGLVELPVRVSPRDRAST